MVLQEKWAKGHKNGIQDGRRGKWQLTINTMLGNKDCFWILFISNACGSHQPPEDFQPAIIWDSLVPLPWKCQHCKHLTMFHSAGEKWMTRRQKRVDHSTPSHIHGADHIARDRSGVQKRPSRNSGFRKSTLSQSKTPSFSPEMGSSNKEQRQEQM